MISTQQRPSWRRPPEHQHTQPGPVYVRNGEEKMVGEWILNQSTQNIKENIDYFLVPSPPLPSVSSYLLLERSVHRKGPAVEETGGTILSLNGSKIRLLDRFLEADHPRTIEGTRAGDGGSAHSTISQRRGRHKGRGARHTENQGRDKHEFLQTIHNTIHLGCLLTVGVSENEKFQKLKRAKSDLISLPS